MNDYDPKMIGKRIKETAQSKGYTAEKLSRPFQVLCKLKKLT